MSRRSVKKYFRELGRGPATLARFVFSWLFLLFMILATLRAVLAD
jgi:hypothetical protein